MPRTCQHQTRHGAGVYHPAPNGRGFDCFVLLDGNRHRSRQPNEDAARHWIDSLTSQLRTLTRAELLDAQHAASLLPAGYSLTDAARALAEQVGAAAAVDVTLDRAITDYIAARKPYVRPLTLTGYEGILKRVERSIEGEMLSDLTEAAVEKILVGMGPSSRNITLRTLGAFVSWCIKRELLPRSPLARIEKAPRHDAEVHVLTVEQAAALMAAAVKVKPAMVPYFALAMFSGCRPEEIQRLPVAKIGREFIMLDGSLAKKKRARTVPIRPNLRAWLTAYPPKGATVPWSRRWFRDVVVASKLTWHPDVMRHSFGTYAYEVTKNEYEISAEMGNSPAIFHTHYRALAHPGTGRKYFEIRPTIQRQSNGAKKGQ